MPRTRNTAAPSQAKLARLQRPGRSGSCGSTPTREADSVAEGIMLVLLYTAGIWSGSELSSPRQVTLHVSHRHFQISWKTEQNRIEGPEIFECKGMRLPELSLDLKHGNDFEGASLLLDQPDQ